MLQYNLRDDFRVFTYIDNPHEVYSKITHYGAAVL